MLVVEALFSYQANCCRADLQMLVLAALPHDLGHQTSPSLAAFLSDADLFPSQNYGQKTQLWLAAKVKFEQ